MKLILLMLALVVTATSFAQAVVNKKKPVAPAKPTPTAPAFPKAQIESAVQAKVEAYFKSNARMSPAQRVTIRITETRKMEGWAGQYITTGTAKIYVPNSNQENQPRSFTAYSTVSGASVEVTGVDSI